MIAAKTCLILGAGASAPYGLPASRALRHLILTTRVPDAGPTALEYPVVASDGSLQDYRTASAANLTPEKRLKHAKESWRDYLQKACLDAGFSDSDIAEFRNLFFRARHPSIDKFIQFNEDESGDIGRTNIAAVLLNCENDCWLSEDWYAQLLSEIAPSGPNEIAEGMLSIVTFNYDRSFECFFTTAFEAGFNLTPKEANDLFNRIKIVHVYGKLGELNAIPYGDKSLIKKAARGITLMRDGNESGCRDEINNLVRAAENVCFIGFAFAPENLGLFDQASFEGKIAIATSLGVSPNRKSEVQKKLKKIKFFDGAATELLSSYNLFASKRSAAKPQQIPVRTPRGFVRSAFNDPLLRRGWQL